MLLEFRNLMPDDPDYAAKPTSKLSCPDCNKPVKNLKRHRCKKRK
jgi:hypothetical protein